ncbi:HD domain-containing protein [Coprothermobacteraceae bacterium]|nr:HD domain-containing protein [Coprothermobacteraceae bacterium]
MAKGFRRIRALLWTHVICLVALLSFLVYQLSWGLFVAPRIEQYVSNYYESTLRRNFMEALTSAPVFKIVPSEETFLTATAAYVPLAAGSIPLELMAPGRILLQKDDGSYEAYEVKSELPWVAVKGTRIQGYSSHEAIMSWLSEQRRVVAAFPLDQMQVISSERQPSTPSWTTTTLLALLGLWALSLYHWLEGLERFGLTGVGIIDQRLASRDNEIRSLRERLTVSEEIRDTLNRVMSAELAQPTYNKSIAIYEPEGTYYLRVDYTGLEPPERLSSETMKYANTVDYGTCLIYYEPDDDENLSLASAEAVKWGITRYLAIASRKETETRKRLLEVLMHQMELKDINSINHSLNVAKIARLIAQAMGLSERTTELIYEAALLHDIGKVLVPAEVLNKASELDPLDWSFMKEHPIWSAYIVEQVPELREIGFIVLHHHTYYNGGGYPGGLEGSAIPLETRVLTVADSIEAMYSDRLYRPRLYKGEVARELMRYSGTHYDPEVVKYALWVLQSLEEDTLPIDERTGLLRWKEFLNQDALISRPYYLIYVNLISYQTPYTSFLEDAGTSRATIMTIHQALKTWLLSEGKGLDDGYVAIVKPPKGKTIDQALDSLRTHLSLGFGGEYRIVVDAVQVDNHKDIKRAAQELFAGRFNYL